MSVVLYNRQKVLMRFLSLAGGRMDRLRLTKLVFLFRQETTPSGFYGFLPYRFGPYSFQLFKEIDRLSDWSYISLDRNQIALTRIGEAASQNVTRQTAIAVDSVHERYAPLTTDALLDYVYQTNPWYTVNSERRTKPNVERPRVECATYTCGYEGLRVDDFLDLLLRKGIHRIIDVRNNPVSMQYGFHKKTLASLAANIGIGYDHFPDLGIPSIFRRHLEKPSDYLQLFEKYVSEILGPAVDTMKEVVLMMRKEPSVLVCMEADPKMCHRTSLANTMSVLSGLPVQDLRDEPIQEN